MYFDFKTISKAIITKLLDCFIANNACSKMIIVVSTFCRFVYLQHIYLKHVTSLIEYQFFSRDG